MMTLGIWQKRRWSFEVARPEIGGLEKVQERRRMDGFQRRE